MSTYAQTFRADFRASPSTSVLGSVTAVIGTSIRHTARLSMMGDWSFQIPQAVYTTAASAYIVNGAYVELYSLIGASAVKEFSGYITSIEEDWRPPSQGAHTMTLRGKDDLWELRQKVIRKGEIYDTGTIIPIYAGTQAGVDGRGATDTLPNLIDNNAATGETFALYDPFLPATTGSGDPSIIYIGNDAPFDLITLDFDASGTNAKTGTLVTQIFKVGRDFTGWDTVAITDGTTVAGVPFAQDGSISWTKEPAEKQELHDGHSLYFARFFITNLTTIGRTDTMDIRGVTVRSWIAPSDDVQTLVTDSAYGNWSLHASSETGTQEGFVVTLYGDSVLNALFDLAERSGESFALTDSQEIRWIDPANPPSSGITAESDLTHKGNSSYCHITSMSRKREYRQIIKTVIPRGGGDDEVSAVTLANLEADPSTGYTDWFFTLPSGYTVDTDGGVYVSITNGNLSSDYDEAIEYVDFPNVSALRGGTGPNRQTADELAKAAIAYLQNHASESKYYNARVAGLDWTAGAVYPGMTMTVSGEITAQDGTATETINESLVIIEMTRTFNSDGMRFFDIKFGNKQQIEPTPLFQNAKRSFKTKQKLRHPQPASVSKLHGASNSIGAGVANPTPVGVHDIESVYHTTTMADGSVLGSDGTVPTEITFGTGFSFNSTTNEYTVNGSAVTGVDHDDLTNVTANQHHNQQHGIVSSDHTVTGSANQIVGLTGTNTLGLLTPTSNALVNPAQIMISDANGDIEVRYLTASRVTIDDVDINTEFSTDHIVYQNDGGDTVYFGLSTADDSWATPSYSNSWVDFDASTVTQYRLLPDGTVVLNIHAKNGTNNTTAFNVASKYRPQKVLYFPAIYNNQSMGRVTVNTNGNVTLYYSGGITSGQLFAAQCVYSVL